MNPALRENDERAERRRPGRQVRPIVVQAVGKPEAVSSLARLLLARRQARLAEVPKDDESRITECRSHETSPASATDA